MLYVCCLLVDITARIFWRKKYFVLSNFTLTKETETKKTKVSIFLHNFKCHHLRIEDLQNFSAIFVSVSLVREKFEETIEFVFQKIWAYPTGNVFDGPHYTPQIRISIQTKIQLTVHILHTLYISNFRLVCWYFSTNWNFWNFPWKLCGQGLKWITLLYLS